VHARELRVDESALTGESTAATKGTAAVDADAALPDRVSAAYASTMVTAGRGRTATLVGAVGFEGARGLEGTASGTCAALANSLNVRRTARGVTCFSRSSSRPLSATTLRAALTSSSSGQDTSPMIEARIRASIEAYIAAWNEHDAAQRMRLIEQACAEELIMRTPGKRIEGRGALDALIADFQHRRPGARAVLSSAVDVQGNVFRYVGMVEGATIARGGETFDAGESDEDGRIRLLLTFVGAALPSRT
jgi:hypothetical protein